MKPNIPDACISRCKTLSNQVIWHTLWTDFEPHVCILPDQILISPEKTCDYFGVLSPDSLINLTHLASSFPMNTLHLGASNSFNNLIQSLSNEVFANHVLSFAHMVENSRLLCMSVFTDWKFQEDAL